MWNKASVKRHGDQADLVVEAEREMKLQARVAMETQARGTSDDSGQAYGQIKRRQSAVDKAKREIDED
jgi:hypothetical protein